MGVLNNLEVEMPISARNDDSDYLNLPSEICQKYMDACFRHGPDSNATKEVRKEFASYPMAAQFAIFADAIDDLKRAVTQGTERSDSPTRVR